MVEVPSHVNKELYKSGKFEFEKEEYAGLKNFVRALQASDMDASDVMMNVQGDSLGTVNGVVAPEYIGSHTIDEFIKMKADVAELEEYDIPLEDAFISWESGARDALMMN